MAHESPLFQSSLDLLAHAIEHFNAGTDRDRKFVILHLANSVELIFKDLLLDMGDSIYKNPKETISITGAIEILVNNKKCTIPYLNKLELLIDERNALQHRFGFPNELTTIFYMDSTFNFFREFLKNNYNSDIDTVLEDFLSEEDFATFQLRKVSTKNELDKLAKLVKVHPIGALLSAYAYLEKILSEATKPITSNATVEEMRETRFLRMRLSSPDYLPRLLAEYEIDLSDDARHELFEFRNLRNHVSHGREEPSSERVSEFIQFIKEIEPKIKELKEKVVSNPRLVIEKEQERDRLRMQEVDMK